MTAIYGMNKYAGTEGDKKRIAKEIGITSEHFYNPKLINERILKNYSTNWFVTDPEERDLIEVKKDNPTISITCPSCGEVLGIDKIIDLAVNKTNK